MIRVIRVIRLVPVRTESRRIMLVVFRLEIGKDQPTGVEAHNPRCGSPLLLLPSATGKVKLTAQIEELRRRGIEELRN